MNTSEHATDQHPILGIGPEWEVTNFLGTVEIYNRHTRLKASFQKPYDPQTPEWWKEQAIAAIAKAEGTR